jgi:hypothetical protein
MLRRAVDGFGRIENVTASGVDPDAEVDFYPDDRATPIRLELRPWSAQSALDDPSAIRDRALLLVLRRAPEQLLSALRQEGRNFVDIGRGIVRLSLPGVLIDRTDIAPAPRIASPQRWRDPFADRASLVARTLFSHPDKPWRTRELAEAAGVSPMVASYAVRQLATWGVVNATRPGRAAQIRLRSERALIERWTSSYDWRKNARQAFAAPMGDRTRFLHRLPRLLSRYRWALTMQAGASIVAPHAMWDKVHIYVNVPRARDLQTVGAAAGWEPDPAGEVVLMQPWYDDAIWVDLQVIQAVPVVSTLQLILDLWHYPVRGREQAEHLLETHLAQRRRAAHAAR